MKMPVNNAKTQRGDNPRINPDMNGGRNARNPSINSPRYPEGCHCYNACNVYSNYQCGTKCSCEFWYDSEQKAIEHSHDMMVQNAYFRDKYSVHGRTYRPGNDYYGRQPLEIEGNVEIMNQTPHDRRNKSAGDPFKKVISGKRTDSWDRYSHLHLSITLFVIFN